MLLSGLYYVLRRLSPKMLKQMQTELYSMSRVGILSRANSEWARPLDVVEKSIGFYHPWCEYRKLNSITTRPAFSILHLFNFVNNLKRSKIDLCQTYHHISVTATVRDKTTDTTTFGNYCFNMMPFGLCGAPSTFMKLMSEVKNGLVNEFLPWTMQ